MEGVDRNTVRNVEGADLGAVALLMEGVDRNTTIHVSGKHPFEVALLMEGVDRNLRLSGVGSGIGSRPPHGGRG